MDTVYSLFWAYPARSSDPESHPHPIHSHPHSHSQPQPPQPQPQPPSNLVNNPAARIPPFRSATLSFDKPHVPYSNLHGQGQSGQPVFTTTTNANDTSSSLSPVTTASFSTHQTGYSSGYHGGAGTSGPFDPIRSGAGLGGGLGVGGGQGKEDRLRSSTGTALSVDDDSRNTTGRGSMEDGARRMRRTKTVQEVWFGDGSRVGGGEYGVVPEEAEGEAHAHGLGQGQGQGKGSDPVPYQDPTGPNSEPTPTPAVVMDQNDRPLTLEWARNVSQVIGTQSDVKITVEIVFPSHPHVVPSPSASPSGPTPSFNQPNPGVGTMMLNVNPIVPAFHTSLGYPASFREGPPSFPTPLTPHRAQQGHTQGHTQGQTDTQRVKGKARFLFRFQGTYAKVLFAKSALRREIMPETKAEVSFPLTQIYNLSALFPSLNTSRASSGINNSSSSSGLSPNTIIPEVRAKLNEIAMKTGVLLTIDDPVVRRNAGVKTSMGTGTGTGTGTTGTSRQGSGVQAGPGGQRRQGSGSSGSVGAGNGTGGRRGWPNKEETGGNVQPTGGQGTGEQIVMDSPESIHMELPNTTGSNPSTGDSAGVIGEKPNSRQGSRRGSLEVSVPPRSATSSRFFPQQSSDQGFVPAPSPTSNRFSGIMDAQQLQEEMLNQTFESLGFIKEGTCVIVIQGLAHAVAAAKTLLLVLSDELNGLHVETIEISEVLHRILAGRKNGVVNNMMALTETNIYFPQGKLVLAENQASYGSLSPVMSPPLRFSPYLGGAASLGGAGSPGLGAGFGTGPPPTGIPGLVDPTVPDLSTGLNALNLNGGMHQKQQSTLSPDPARMGWPSPGLLSPAGPGPAGVNANTVYITGASAIRVLNAKEWLLRLAFDKNAAVLPFQSQVSPRKLDWLIHEKSEEIRKAMFDNGCTVRLIPDSRTGWIQVIGDHEISIRRTMKHIIKLLTDTCLAATWIVDTMNVTSKYDIVGEARRLAIETDVETATGASCIEVFSGKSGISGVRRVFDLIENPTSLGYASHVQFQFQPLIEHQEFLAGKGNGKIVMMSRKSNSKVQLVECSDRLFTLDIRSDSIASVAIALGILQDELPAETSFYLPESFHRKIIGRNGKNIQEIMYKHNVAVRFSSKEQWAEFGGHEENEDNVLIITPAKNATVIDRVKDIVMEHVPEDTRYYAPRRVVPLPRACHASIQSNPVVSQWQERYGAVIRCLPREQGLDGIEVYSALNTLPLIEPILRSLIPLERLALLRTNVHPSDLPDWHTCVQNVLDTTAVSTRLSSMFRDDRMVGIVFSSGIRDVARFEAAKNILERYFAERQKPEIPVSFSPWGNNDAAGTNSIVFARVGNEAPVQYENRNFRSIVKNGKTGSLDPSMTTDWMERTANSSPFESIPEETTKPKGLAHRLRVANVRTQSLDLKGFGGGVGYQPSPSPTSSHFGSSPVPLSASSIGFPQFQN